MNALTHTSFQHGRHIEAEAAIPGGSPRLARIAATGVGALVAVYLLFVASTMPRQATQPAVGSFAPAIPAFDNQFDPLELDMTAKTSSVVANNQFDPLELDMTAKPRNSVVALVEIPFDPLLP